MICTFDSSMTGAPVLSGTAGALSAVLKACLVDGFGAGSVATLTVSAGIATATFAGAHPYRVGTVAQFAGATPAGLNGQKRILATTTNSVTFDATGIADGTATGTITHKVAAAGWQELFAGTLTNVLCLKSTLPEATGCVVRVGDTGTTSARLRGYESMTAASAGVGLFPTDAQLSGGVWWGKSDTANTTARPWRMWSNGRAVLMWISPSSAAANQVTGQLYVFGDYVPYRSGDAYSCLLTGGTAFADVSASINTFTGCVGYGNGIASPASAFVARAPLGVGGSLNVRKLSASNSAAAYSGTAGYNANVFVYPNVADNALRLAPLELYHPNYGLLGRVPGVYHCAQTLGESFATGDEFLGEGVYAGKKFVALRVGPLAGGTVFIDTTGEWEL